MKWTVPNSDAAAAAGNPLLAAWDGPDDAPPFDRADPELFLPAFAAAIAGADAELAAIAADPAPPTFENSVVALERSGAALGRVRRLFWTLTSAQSVPALRAIEGEVSAMLTRHGTRLGHDPALFARVAAVKRAAPPPDEESRRLLDTSFKGFVRGGAQLGPADKARFAAIDARLAALSIEFGQAVLAATQAEPLVLEEARLAGLPASVREAAARRAEAAGMAGRWLFPRDRGSFEDVTTFAEDRGVREAMWRAFAARCNDGGPHDTNAIVAEVLALRHELAGLLGHPDYAAFALEDSMARTPAAAEGLLMRVWAPARAQALEEAAMLQALIDADAAAGSGPAFQLEPWDWRFYAERVRRERYALDGAAVKAHLRLDAVREAAFAAAGRLYGLVFEARPALPVYHPDVRAWAVRDGAGRPVGLLYTDYFARPEKHGGAWMGSLRVQEALDGAVRPIVYTVANFAKAPDPAESRLSLDEARTLFHEFGHALHALLSRVTYPSLAGTAVARDFVEFPSKFMEHWILSPELLRGFGVPDDLIAAIHRAESFGQGFATVEFVAAAIVDLALHRAAPADVADPAGFAQATLAAIGLPRAIVPRHQLQVFTHVFDGGYAAAYYSYLWSEVLDADAFAAFAEAGDLFDPVLAARFRDEILCRGDSRDPMASFIAFRGRPPQEEALLKTRGLLP